MSIYYVSVLHWTEVDSEPANGQELVDIGADYIALIDPTTIPRRYLHMKSKAKQDVYNAETILQAAQSEMEKEDAKRNLDHVKSLLVEAEKKVQEELVKAQAFRELEDQKIANEEQAEIARLDAILETAESKEWEEAKLAKENIVETAKIIAKVKAAGEARIKEKLKANV